MRWKPRLKRARLKVDRRVESGVTSDRIVQGAERGNHDLIVLGSRGLGTVKRFLLGSVSDDVSHKAKMFSFDISGKTCELGDPCVEELMSLFDKILVPLDGSRSSARALEAAIAIAKKFNGEITLIHVYSLLTSEVEESMLTPSGNSLPPSEVYRVTKDAIRKAGANLLSKNEEMVKAKGISVEKLLKEGHVVQEIREVAKEGKYDLIVIGVKGISEVRETLLGSVSEKVIRNAQCPVLVIK